MIHRPIQQGWDMDAFLVSGQFLRAVDLFCFACIVFDVVCFELLVMRFINEP